MRAVDTNVLVRLVTAGDPVQVRAAENFVADGGAWVSLVVVAEAMWVLESFYKRSRAELAAVLETLLDHRLVTLQDADVVEGALVEFKRRPSIAFSDCLVLECARKAGHALGTFDRSLASRAGATRIR